MVVLPSEGGNPVSNSMAIRNKGDEKSEVDCVDQPGVYLTTSLGHTQDNLRQKTWRGPAWRAMWGTTAARNKGSEPGPGGRLTWKNDPIEEFWNGADSRTADCGASLPDNCALQTLSPINQEATPTIQEGDRVGGNPHWSSSWWLMQRLTQQSSVFRSFHYNA